MDKRIFPIVKYDNRLNEMAFGKLSANELDIFTAMCAKIRDKNTEIIEFSYSELMEYSRYKGKSLARFRNDLKTTNQKLNQLTIEIVSDDGDRTMLFTLFPTFMTNDKAGTLTVQVHSMFTQFFNDLTGNFTRFELAEHVEIKSKYGKLLYRLLKQFRKSGYFTIKVEDFRERLDVPESYRMSDIDKRVIKPSMKELEHYFKNLKVEKKYAAKGREVEFFIFTFEKEAGINIGSQNDFKKPNEKRNPKLDIDPEEEFNPKFDEEIGSLFDSDFWE